MTATTPEAEAGAPSREPGLDHAALLSKATDAVIASRVLDINNQQAAATLVAAVYAQLCDEARGPSRPTDAAVADAVRIFRDDPSKCDCYGDDARTSWCGNCMLLMRRVLEAATEPKP